MTLLTRLFEQRIRGLRLIEVIGVILAVTVFMWVTISKALVRDDISRLNDINGQIESEMKSINALRVQVASLERPSRLEKLATQELGMKPVDPKQEASIDSLPELARTSQRPMADNSDVVSAKSLDLRQGPQVSGLPEVTSGTKQIPQTKKP